MTAGVFPPDIVSFAQAAQRKWGCPASVALAQWALESSWGSRMSGRNNPFGIKAAAGTSGTSVATHEQNAAGVAHAERDVFADYGSMAEAFDAHGRFLSTKRYAPVLAAKTPDDAARALRECGYATDVQYPAKLISIMKAHDLYQFDKLGAPFLPPPAPAKPVHKGKAAAGAVVVAAGAGAALVPHGSYWIADLVAVAMIAAAVFLAIHFKK